ncbi:hypothetical protein ACFMB7_32665 (plasmid) [Bacillus toyonensis]
MCSYCDGYHSNKRFPPPICKFLENLTAGDDVDTLIIGGQNQNVDAFTRKQGLRHLLEIMVLCLL